MDNGRMKNTLWTSKYPMYNYNYGQINCTEYLWPDDVKSILQSYKLIGRDVYEIGDAFLRNWFIS